MEHSKLPWKVSADIVVHDADGETVVLGGFAITGMNRRYKGSQAEANTALVVTACNNFEMAVELLKEFTSGGYICDDCEARRHTEECSTCKHGIALQLLSEIEGGK